MLLLTVAGCTVECFGLCPSDVNLMQYLHNCTVCSIYCTCKLSMQTEAVTGGNRLSTQLQCIDVCAIMP